jgi:multidrug efflux system outer membrane protein
VKLARLVLIPTLLAAGCATAPPVVNPDIGVEVPDHWTAIDHVDAATRRTIDRAWWRDLGDASLDSIIAEALDHNHDLRAAAARLGAAEAAARIARADRFPSAEAGTSATRTKRNFIGFPSFGASDGGTSTGASSGVVSTRSTQYGVSLDVSWELDLWGRIRAGHAAALADAQVAASELEAARLSIAAQTAKAWFAVLESREQLELGLALTDVAAAEALVRRRQEELERGRRQLEILLGRYPAGEVEAVGSLPDPAAPVPAGLPADLVARRPDVVAAERRLAASRARVSEAKAALYPRIALTGSGGTSSEQLKDLVDLDFSVWTLAANLAQPIFQGGRLLAGIDSAKSARDESLADYAQTLLEAYGEVESELDAQSLLQERERYLGEAAEQSTAAKALAEERYLGGVEDYVTVLSSQRSALEARSNHIAIRRARLDSRIDLYVALGGGFDAATVTGRATAARTPGGA